MRKNGICMIAEEKLSGILIHSTSSILVVLKEMDRRRRKLFIMVDHAGGRYQGLISIGDLQRAIIDEVSLDTPVINIAGKNRIVVGPDDSIEQVKKLMASIRSEFMPVIDASGNLLNVYLWEDFFGDEMVLPKYNLDLPVVIMAGGKSSRLKPISNIIPKPLIPIGEKTIIENIMDRFVHFGCNNFYISVNYKKELIQHYFESLSQSEYQIEYFMEDQPLGTAGSLYLLKGKINKTFFVSNCDILIDQDYHELYKYHHDHNNEITLVAALKHFKISYGTVESGFGGILQSMHEKPELTFKINAGLYVLEPQLLNEIPENKLFHITELIEKVQRRGGKVGVFPVSEGSWLDIGEWPEYVKTVRSLSNNIDQFQGLL